MSTVTTTPTPDPGIPGAADEPADDILRTRLAELLPGRVASPEDTAAHAHDTSDGTPAGRPLALVYPASVADVQAAVRFAAAHRLPIVPQGALSGLTGASNALDRSILINLSHYHRIVSIDDVDQTATVQAGVIVGDLSRAVREHGLTYPPDPASLNLSTIGGNLATNAGGMACVKYGVTKDFVRQLTVVLASGEAVTLGHRTVKGVSGLDLASLFVGSEGTLGVICEAVVALRPLPGAPVGISALFGDERDAFAAAAGLRASRHIPSTLEYLDGPTIQAIRRFDPAAGLPEHAGAMLLVQADDYEAEDAALAEYRQILSDAGAARIDVARDAEQLDRLMYARRLLHDALQAVEGASLNEDVSVPLSRLPDLFAGLRGLSTELGVPIYVGGHIGDGNVHPVLCYAPGDAEAEAVARRGYRRVIQLAISLGGVASGEHGIGQLKLDVVEEELGADVRALQRTVKAALDPLGILNPGRKY
jgi:glycolate oxidase